MLETAITILVGLLGGVAVGLQSPIGGAMSQRVGGAAGSLIVHLGGAVVSAGLLLARGGEQIRHWRGLPWYTLGSGALGVLLFLTISRTIPRLGATMALVLIIVGQLLIGMVIDHFGWFGVNIRPIRADRVAAALLLLGGAILMARR